MAELVLRPARLADALAIAHVHHGAVHALEGGHYAAGILARWAPAVTIARAEKLFRETQDEGATTLVVETGDDVVGFAIATAKHGTLDACYVAPVDSRRGIGRLLVGALEGAVRTAGNRAMTLRAPIGSTGFYFRLGYETAGTGAYRFEDGTDMPVVLMRKDL